MVTLDEAIEKICEVPGARITDISPVEGHDGYVSIAFVVDEIAIGDGDGVDHSAIRAACPSGLGQDRACRECHVDRVTVNENGDAVYHRN